MYERGLKVDATFADGDTYVVRLTDGDYYICRDCPRPFSSTVAVMPVVIAPAPYTAVLGKARTRATVPTRGPRRGPV